MNRDHIHHKQWMVGLGYRPDRRTIAELIDSHLEALDEIDRLISELRAAKEAR